MMRAMHAIITRDLARSWQEASWWLPVAFFLLVATLFPFALGPDPVLLARVGPGVMLVALLLAALLPVERLIGPDVDTGHYDRLALAGVADESIIAAKWLAHLVTFTLPLLLAAPLAAPLLNMSADQLGRCIFAICLSAPGLASLAMVIAAISAAQRGTSALAGLMLIPLAIPLLIFAAGMFDQTAKGAPWFLAATSLLLSAITPFAAGAALRAARER